MGNSIPAVTKNLILVNVLAYAATWLLEMRGISLPEMGGLYFFMDPRFHLYQFFTYQFLHGSLSHLFWNMFALYMFGVVMERVWGAKKFLFYYISCGVGAGFIQEVVQFMTWSGGLTIGASGSIYAILLAFGMTFPEERIMLLIPPIPIKAKWFVVGYAAIELVLAMSQPGDGVAHIAHLGGMLFGFFMIRYWNKHPNSNFDRRSSANSFFDSLRRNFERHQQGNSRQSSRNSNNQTRRPESDMEYNQRRRQRQEEIDRILDKVRRSGYDSLTKEEKMKLFEASREK